MHGRCHESFHDEVVVGRAEGSSAVKELSQASIEYSMTSRYLYPKWDSNPHIFRYCILSATRLPIPPFGLGTLTILHNFEQLPNAVGRISHVQ